MGYRTVVVLANDQQHSWESDPELGAKIAATAARINRAGQPYFEYGNIVEVEHADQQRLVILDSYNGTVIAEKGWLRNETQAEVELALLKQAAEKLGYRLKPINSSGADLTWNR